MILYINIYILAEWQLMPANYGLDCMKMCDRVSEQERGRTETCGRMTEIDSGMKTKQYKSDFKLNEQPNCFRIVQH